MKPLISFLRAHDNVPVRFRGSLFLHNISGLRDEAELPSPWQALLWIKMWGKKEKALLQKIEKPMSGE